MVNAKEAMLVIGEDNQLYRVLSPTHLVEMPCSGGLVTVVHPEIAGEVTPVASDKATAALLGVYDLKIEKLTLAADLCRGWLTRLGAPQSALDEVNNAIGDVVHSYRSG